MTGDMALHIFSFVALVASLYANRIAYKHGIWDGAFNQFIPHVRKAMFEYDPVVAQIILDEREERLHGKQKYERWRMDRRTSMDVKERVERRMKRIDALPKDVRALVHEYGWGPIDALLSAGVKNAKVMRHIITQVLRFNTGIDTNETGQGEQRTH